MQILGIALMFAGFLWAITPSGAGYDAFAALSDWVILAGVVVSLAGIFVDRILDRQVHISREGAIAAAVTSVLVPLTVFLALIGV